MSEFSKIFHRFTIQNNSQNPADVAFNLVANSPLVSHILSKSQLGQTTATIFPPY
jgi:hypothetical protein